MTERQATTKERYQQEIAAAEEDFKSSYQEQEHEWLDELRNFELQYSNDIQTLNDHIGKLTQNIIDLQSYSQNPGEIVTHQILEQLKREMIQEGVISNDEMIILPNVFIPYEEDGYLKTRQIDHLVLLPTGFYVVETKYWRGKIVHGLTQENAQAFSFIADMMTSSNQSSKKKHTLVFVPDQEFDEKKIQIRSYGNPTQQVMETAMTLKRYIHTHLDRDIFITPIVYFGYPSDEKTQGVIDLSDNQTVPRLVGEAEIRQYFRDQLQMAEKKHSKEILKETKEGLENINYIQSKIDVDNRENINI